MSKKTGIFILGIVIVLLSLLVFQETRLNKQYDKDSGELFYVLEWTLINAKINTENIDRKANLDNIESICHKFLSRFTALDLFVKAQNDDVKLLRAMSLDSQQYKTILIRISNRNRILENLMNDMYEEYQLHDDSNIDDFEKKLYEAESDENHDIQLFIESKINGE